MGPLFIVLLIVLVFAEMQTGGSVTAAQKLANAIAQAEGAGVPGSVPQRANNPGDLEIGDPYGMGTIAGKTIFPSLADGMNALVSEVGRMLGLHGTSIYSPDMTISEVSTLWVNGSKEVTADSQAWASNVAKALGVSVDTPIGSV